VPFFPYNKNIHEQLTLMTLPSYNAISFHSKEEHTAALYDACLMIVNTYNSSDMLDDYKTLNVTAYEFMQFARNVLNQIGEGN
jgi:hypothetical protein